MSLLEVEDAQAAGIGAELDPAALQTAIDEEEAWLARRIGPLAGERTQRFPLALLRPTQYEVRLRRPTDEVEVTQDGVDVTADTEVRGDGWRVAYLLGGVEGYHFRGVLEVTYTPNDELEVRRALRELLGLTLGTQGSGGLSSEIMGSYSYTRGAGSVTRIRRSIVRGLLEPPAAGSTRVLSSVRHGLAGRVSR